MAFSTSGAGQGAAQGAQIGMNFGPWGALIGAAAGAIGGGIEGGKIEKANKKLLKYQNAIVDQRRELRNERNKLLMQETARAEAELMKERTYILRNTSEAVNYIERTSGIQKADISVQNAVADAIGSSAAVQYSVLDAARAEQEARAWLDQEVQIDNWQTSMTTMLKQARSMVDTTAYSHLVQMSDPSAMSKSLLALGEVAGSAYSKGMFNDIFKQNSGGTYGKTNVPVNGALGFKAGRGPGR